MKKPTPNEAPSPAPRGLELGGRNKPIKNDIKTEEPITPAPTKQPTKEKSSEYPDDRGDYTTTTATETTNDKSIVGKSSNDMSIVGKSSSAKVQASSNLEQKEYDDDGGASNYFIHSLADDLMKRIKENPAIDLAKYSQFEREIETGNKEIENENKAIQDSNKPANLGDREKVGLAPYIEKKAKPENVLVEPEVRKDSINRFANFKWVDSIQNSKLGNASSLYELNKIDEARRYNGAMYYLTSKHPLDNQQLNYLSKTKAIKDIPLGLIPRDISSTDYSNRQPITSYGWARYKGVARPIMLTENEFNTMKPSKKIGVPWNAEYKMSNIQMNRREDTPAKNPLIYPSIMEDNKGNFYYN